MCLLSTLVSIIGYKDGITNNIVIRIITYLAFSSLGLVVKLVFTVYTSLSVTRSDSFANHIYLDILLS